MVHLCCFFSLAGSLPSDLREHQIRVVPVIVCMIAGLAFQLVTCRFSFKDAMVGMLPAIGSFAISKTCRECIGKGDILLILGIGILNGIVFCLEVLGIALVCIFVYCTFMLALGKIKRNSQVACVPFLLVGYLGAWFL